MATENNETQFCTFEKFDCLNRQEFAQQLTKIITSLYRFSEGAYVLSLNASYGSGKTTFLKMWENELTHGQQKYEVISINAWETDFGEDPIIALVSSLYEHIKKQESKSQKTTNFLKKIPKILPAVISIGNQISKRTIGVDWEETIEDINEVKQSADDLANTKSQDIQEIGEELYNNFIYKRDAYKSLNEGLTDYVAELQGKPLIILVDELDRVRPNYAVEFLEAIKHLFAVQGICFVLAVDRDQLEKSIKQIYGEIDFANYYLRFITNQANLPTIVEMEQQHIQKLVQSFYSKYETEELKFAINQKQQPILIRYIIQYSRIFSLRPRQIDMLIRKILHFIVVDNQRTNDEWDLIIESVVFFIAIYIDDDNIYHQIGKKQISAKELHDYLKDKIYYNYERNPPKKSLHYKITTIIICLMFADINENDINNILEPYKQDTELNHFFVFLQEKGFSGFYSNGWYTGFHDHFINHYQKIEKWRSMGDR